MSPIRRKIGISFRAGALVLATMWPALLSSYGPFKQRGPAKDWQILSTPHFDVYYYPQEEPLAKRAGVLAEKALKHNSRVLETYPKARIPLFIFQDHLDFQQTNISQEVIGPGTGGFTEAFKNRMVLPTTGSDRWLETVITHELAHALQFNILYGEGARSFQVFRNYIIPLWVMEGMAEVCAENWDSFADMVLRDAVIHDRLPDLQLMDGFSHLDEVYLAYKAGQSALQHLVDTQGPDSVAKLMRKYKAQISTNQILKDLTGKDYAAFNSEWKASLRQRYWTQVLGKEPASRYGMALTTDDSRHLTHNNGTAWSPDGKQVAYISTRGNREEIWVMDVDGKRSRVLTSGPFEEIGRSGPYGVPGKRLSWSPDGRSLCFVRSHSGRKWLTLLDVQRGSLRDLLGPDTELAAPSHSPDGKKLAFASFDHGRAYLKVIDLASGSTEKALTVVDDPELSMISDPTWSPDGVTLAFTAEKNRLNQVYLVASGGGPLLRASQEGVDSIQAAFSHDGSRVYFSAAEGGTYDLWQIRADGTELKRITRARGGFFAPNPSPDGRSLLFISYEDGCQNIYRMLDPNFTLPAPSPGLQALADPYRFQAPRPSMAQASSGTAEIEAAPGSLSASAAVLESPLDPASFGSAPYRTRITPDLFFLLMGYDSLTGLVGGGYLTASDMLGDHGLAFYVNFVPGYQSVAQADYLFLRGVIDVGFSAFYRNTNYFLSNLNPQQFASTFVDLDWGATLFGRLPLSKFTRVEAGLTSRRLFRELNGPTNLDPELLSTLGDAIVQSLSLSWTKDTFTYRNFQPHGGYRVQLASSYADKVLGGTRNFVLHQAEIRAGLPLDFLSRDTVLSVRALGLEQSGSDRQLFYFGGQQVRGLSYNEQISRHYGVANFQIRQPYLKRLNGTLWPLDFLLIKDIHLVGFYDLGVAPFDWDAVTAADLRGGYGGGMRLHSFLFEKLLLLFSFDVAQRTDRPGATYYYFTLGQIF